MNTISVSECDMEVVTTIEFSELYKTWIWLCKSLFDALSIVYRQYYSKIAKQETVSCNWSVQ